MAHPVAVCLLGAAYIFAFALVLSTLFIALMNITLQRVGGQAGGGRPAGQGRAGGLAGRRAESGWLVGAALHAMRTPETPATGGACAHSMHRHLHVALAPTLCTLCRLPRRSRPACC